MIDAIEAALALIRKAGSLRTPALAEQLGLGEAAVDAMLEPARADGRVITCNVTAGGREVIEYRCSVSGQSVNLRDATWRARQAHVAAAQSSRGETEPSSSSRLSSPEAARTAAPTTPKGERTMTVRDRIEAALTAHGPMTAQELRKHVDVEGLSGICSGLWKRGIIRKLGGGARSSIYGLPSQKLEERKVGDALERGAELGRKKRKGRAKKAAPARAKHARKRRLKRTSRIPAPATPSPAARKKGGFRPAIAGDGALLFMGAARGDFELERAQARGFVEILRRLTPAELDLTADFLKTLDGAELAA